MRSGSTARPGEPGCRSGARLDRHRPRRSSADPGPACPLAGRAPPAAPHTAASVRRSDASSVAKPSAVGACPRTGFGDSISLSVRSSRGYGRVRSHDRHGARLPPILQARNQPERCRHQPASRFLDSAWRIARTKSSVSLQSAHLLAEASNRLIVCHLTAQQSIDKCGRPATAPPGSAQHLGWQRGSAEFRLVGRSTGGLTVATRMQGIITTSKVSTRE